MTVHRTVLIATAVVVLLASNHTTAQAPQPTSDAERLKALEAKMDKVLKLLEGNAPQPVTKEALDKVTKEVREKTAQLLWEAQQAVANKFEADQKAYLDWRTKSPLSFDRKGVASLNTQRTAKYATLITDLQQREAEVAARSALVKNAGNDEKKAAGLLVFLQRRGLDVELLRRTVPHGRDEGVTAVHLVGLYGESLKLETEELERQIEAAQNRIEQDRKEMRDLNAYEVTEERLRTNRDNSQKLLDVIVQRLGQIDVIKSFGPKP